MPISRTAQHVALFRALESTESARAPLFQDRLAPHLLPWRLRLAVKLSVVPQLRSLILQYAEKRAPGVRDWVIARTCFIDDCVRAALAAGIRQIVLLGAGYDSRAHRLPGLASASVFEVDRAQTQIDKRQRLSRAGVQAGAGLRYVSADFRNADFGQQLVAAGYAQDQRSLFICEGVLVYLDAATVERMLRFVGSTARDSRLVFTYGPTAALNDGAAHTALHRQLSERVRHLGEPWTFSIEPRELEGYLARFGLTLERNVSMAECKRIYLEQLASGSEAADFSRLAVANVAV